MEEDQGRPLAGKMARDETNKSIAVETRKKR
jgi:hypothetical protein